MKIYIAGPISFGGTLDRSQQRPHVEKAVQVGIEVLRKGHCPYIPHLTYFVPDCGIHDMTYEEYLAWDFQWVDTCDAILYLAPCPGSDRELERAKRHGKIMFYSVDEIPNLKDVIDN